MSRRKWAVFALVQVFILAIMVSGQKLQLWDARVQRAGWFFYLGLTFVTLVIIIMQSYSAGIKNANSRGGIALAVITVKLLLNLCLLVIYLVIGGFSSSGEGGMAIALYVIYSTLGFYLSR